MSPFIAVLMIVMVILLIGIDNLLPLFIDGASIIAADLYTWLVLGIGFPTGTVALLVILALVFTVVITREPQQQIQVIRDVFGRATPAANGNQRSGSCLTRLMLLASFVMIVLWLFIRLSL